MTLKKFKENIDDFVSKHPDMLDRNIVVDGMSLYIGQFVEATDDKEEHWDCGPNVAILPENTGAQYA